MNTKKNTAKPGIRKTWARAWAAFAIAAVFVSTLSSSELSADGTEPANNNNCQGSSGQSQLSEYCSTAQSASQGTNVDSALYKVWGGVAAVCTAACVNPSASGTCKWSSRAGAGTDAVATKNYSSALMSIATGQVGAQASKAFGQQTAQNGTSNKPPQSRATSCLNAVTATMQAISKARSAQSSSQTAATSNSMANQLATNDTAIANEPNEKASGASAAIYEPGRSLSEGASGASAGSIASVCASGAAGDTASTIRCAVASDPSLPSYVATPQFLNAFKAASGNDFSNFGNDPSQDPGSAIAQAASGGLDNGTATQVAALMQSMSNQAPYQSAAYASAGGATPSAEAPGTGDADMTKVAQTLMEQMTGQMQAGQKPNQAPGFQAVVVANQTRSPASIPEDKTLSIFDRVSYRYLYTTKVMGMESAR